MSWQTASASLIAAANFPMVVADLLAPLVDPSTLLLLVIMGLTIVVGTALDFAPAIMNNAIGLITPPVGTVPNVESGVARERLEPVICAVLPYLLAQLGVLFLLVLFPSIVLVPLRFFTG